MSGRYCELLWNRGSNFAAITDWEGSNLSDVYLVDLASPNEKKSLDELIPRLFADIEPAEKEGHRYVEALEWKSAAVLIIRVFGHTDETNISHAFLYKLAVHIDSKQVDLIAKERGTFDPLEGRIWEEIEKNRVPAPRGR